MRSRGLGLLAMAAAAAVLAAGCGGDEESATGASEEAPPGVSMTRPQFIKQAGAACREARKGLEDEVARFLRLQEGRKPQPVLYADLTRLVLLPAIEAEMEAIRYLGVPPKEEERVDDILHEGEYAINRLVYEDRIASIDAVYREFAEMRRMFRAYGLPACVNGAGVTSRGS